MIYSEQRLDISFITGEEGAQGTADVVIIKPTEIIVVDLKYGLGVQVEAENNEQLLIYGWAALKEFDLTGDIKTLRLVISQPRRNHTSEWILSVDDARDLIDKITAKANHILTAKGGDLSATPGDTQCRFCRLKADCPEYRQFSAGVITNTDNLFEKDDFLERIENAESKIKLTDDTTLANCMDAVELIESWCDGVRAEIARRLHNDNFSDGRYKLVQGRNGHRKITNVDDVIDLAKCHGIRDEQLYDKDLMSPVSLEKLHKKENPVFWAKVEALMTSAPGKTIVVPSQDKRPALNVSIDFKAISEDDDHIEALLELTSESKS